MERRQSLDFLTYLVVFILACVVVEARVGAFATDRSLTNDEAAHFVSSLMILDYMRSHSLLHPIDFAIDYYEHFPRVALGQWPPFFHLVNAIVLGIFGRSVAVALILQATIAGLVAALTARLVAQRYGFWVGLAAGALMWASPTFLFLVDAVMLDNFLALLTLVTALCWAGYARTRDWRWSVAFALSAAAAILTKGNAFSLALLPPFYCGLTRDWRLLASWKTWMAAGLVAALAIPWHVLTYKIASDSFVYGWGWGYTHLALPGFARLLASSLSVPGLAALLVGAVVVMRRNRVRTDETLTALLAVILAHTVFQVIVPTDIQARYLMPMVPPAVVIAACGVAEMVRWAGTAGGWALSARMVSRLAAVAIAVIAGATFRAPQVGSLHMDAFAQDVLAANARNPFVLVASSGRGEGALIAAFAESDIARTHYVVRGFKVLAAGNFMGTYYRARFSSVDDVAKWIADNQIGWIVVDTSPESLAWAHNRQVLALADTHPADWKKRDVRSHADGETRLYEISSAPPQPTSLEALLPQIAPVKVIGQ